MGLKLLDGISQYGLYGGMNLKTYLQKHRLTETEFAARIGVAQVTVNRYVRGLRFPSPDMVLLIAKETNGRVKVADWYERVAAPERVS